MCIKNIRAYCGVLYAAFGINLACGSVPPGLREALAEFETGAIKPTASQADRKVGSRNEISRFQILPVVWRQYSSSRDYHNPETAWNVTAKILTERGEAFRQATGRDWDYVDIYVMWNAPGQYRRVNWNRAKLSPAVMERAQRFSNLMHERSRLYSNRN